MSQAEARPIEIAPAQRRRRSAFGLFLGQYRQRVLPVAGAVVVAVLILVAIFAPFIAPYPPNETKTSERYQGISLRHPMGTDQLGRDQLSRIIYGARVSLMVGLVAVGLAAGAGVPLGLLAGYLGGWADNVVMRIMDGIFAFPALILALGLVAATGAGILQVMAAIAVVSTPVYARLVRGSTLAVKERDFVLAARSMGAPVTRIIARHIWPNVTAPIIVQASLGIAFAIIAEAGLSFLGLAAVRPPDPTWGSMLRQARDEMARSPVLAIGPGLAIVITVLAFNFVGDGLRDALDPRLRRRG